MPKDNAFLFIPETNEEEERLLEYAKYHQIAVARHYTWRALHFYDELSATRFIRHHYAKRPALGQLLVRHVRQHFGGR